MRFERAPCGHEKKRVSKHPKRTRENDVGKVIAFLFGGLVCSPSSNLMTMGVSGFPRFQVSGIRKLRKL